MTEGPDGDAAFNTAANRLIRREAMRRAAADLNQTSGAGLENALARISAEVTAEAVENIALKKSRPA